MFKRFFLLSSFIPVFCVLTGCSTNPATGENQFTALMSPQQEVQVGAQEHKKIMAQHGIYKDAELQNYVRRVGAKVVQHTERPDVRYQFFLLDSPMVNAFALPGGYIYLTRGLLALSNSEAEVASVLAHEAGHITGRHSAERYSRGVVTSLGAMILSTAIGNTGVSEALGAGTNLYLKSYSRGQESQADGLGIRYLGRSGYDPRAMAGFLSNLQADTGLEAKMAGKSASQSTDYFSTHPATAQRVSSARAQAQSLPQGGAVNRDGYLRMISGMTYGDSADQGFARGHFFYHPSLGFKFSVPKGYKIINQPDQVVAQGKSGALVVFDLLPNKDGINPERFMSEVLLQGQQSSTSIERVTVNGMKAATTGISGSINGKTAQIRLIAVRWSKTQIARFQIAIPNGISSGELNALKSASYSFSRMSNAEKRKLRPYRIKIIAAKSGDSISKMASRMPFRDHRDERFRVLNGLRAAENIVAGRLYKIVVE